MAIEEHDTREGYCRMLGHHVPFSYCRAQADGRPCRRILDCWFEKFDVRSYLATHFSAAEIEAFLAAPKPKMASLIELIEQARNNGEATPP
ncbi:MAG: hypothetical protein GXY44_06010 [Phycisphaerales bacterium]|nr:hypothetical protein [Phycisphaerales bacterium]